MSSLPLRVLAFIGISFMISACGGALGQAHGAGEVGKPAPALAIQSLNGKGAVSLASPSGKVTVVEFWATWSEPSKKSLAQLEELNKKSGGKVNVIGISVDDTTRGVADSAKTLGVSFPIAWDENHTLMRRWNVESPGTTYILDSKGTVRFVHEASKDKDEAEGITREVAQLSNDGPLSNGDTAVASASVTVPTTAAASATVPTAVPVAVADAPPATSTEEATPVSANETTKAGKPKAQPRSGKKSVTKKATKKS